jgi:hypothetical protein
MLNKHLFQANSFVIKDHLTNLDNIPRLALDQALSSKLTESEHKVFNKIFSIGRTRTIFCMSAQTIANQLNINEKTVRRAVIKFISLGFLRKITPKFNSHIEKKLSCIYIVNKNIYSFAEKFKNKFKSLAKYLNLIWVLSWVNVQLFPKRGSINNRVSSNIQSRDITFDQKNTTRNLKKKKLEIVKEIMEVSPPKISPILREITIVLRLTKLGQLKLLVFPEDVLTSVWKQYKKQTKVNNPFEFIVISCIKQCESKNIPIHWDIFYLALKRYDLVDNKKYTTPKINLDKLPSYPVSDKLNSYQVENRVRPHQGKTIDDIKASRNPFLSFLETALDNIKNFV